MTCGLYDSIRSGWSEVKVGSVCRFLRFLLATSAIARHIVIIRGFSRRTSLLDRRTLNNRPINPAADRKSPKSCLSPPLPVLSLSSRRCPSLSSRCCRSWRGRRRNNSSSSSPPETRPRPSRTPRSPSVSPIPPSFQNSARSLCE